MKRKLFIVLNLFLLISLLMSCGNKSQKNAVSGKESLEKITIRMKWYFAGTMTGWFAGKEQGFYNKQNLNLKILPGGPDNNSVKLVASGNDDFGVAGADEVLIARQKGIPVVAIGVLFKDSPLGFISKKQKNITSPKAWNGKTIEVSYGSNAEVQYMALKNKFNVKNVKEVPYTFNLIPFIENKVDISVAYLMDQVITLENKGIELNVQSCKAYGINPYGDVIITSEKMLNEKPDIVEKFLKATINGHKWAIENEEKAVDHLIQNAPELKKDNEIKVWKATIPFLTSDESLNNLCIMTKKRWKETKDILVNYNVIPATVDETNAYIIK